MQPGIYRGVPSDAYHHGPGDSKSGLDLLRKSPALFRAVKTGQRARSSTRAQMTGTSIHAMALEPDIVARTYAPPFVAPNGTLATIEQLKSALAAAGVSFKRSAAKAALEELAREHIPDAPLLTDERDMYDKANRGKIIIEADEWSRLESMLAALRAHPAAMKLLTGPGEAELSAYWREAVIDPVTGEHRTNADGSDAYTLMRARPDYWRHDGIIVDLKSTSPGGAAPEEFARSLDKWRYYVQHWMYLRGAATALDVAMSDNLCGDAAKEFAQFRPPHAFVFVVVETDACVVDGVAMGVAVYHLQPDSVALGRAEYMQDVATLHACTTSSRWPGYAETIQPIELPAYSFTRAAARMGAEQRT